MMGSDPLLVGIGDLHGHVPALEELLPALDGEFGIFASDHRLRDGVEMVFIGDYIDRGTDSRGTIDRVMRLQERNPGNVHTLCGNHELLALAGRATAERVATEEYPERLYRHWTMHGCNGGWSFVQEFCTRPNDACRAFAQALAPDAPIGAWFRRLAPYRLTRIGERRVLFVHGGIPDNISTPHDLEAYASAFAAHLATSTASGERKYLEHPLVNGQSIFWDRRIPNGTVLPDDLVRQLDIDTLVIGHTAQERITRYGTSTYDIDVGMSPIYGANGPAAIVFTPSEIIAFDMQQGITRPA